MAAYHRSVTDFPTALVKATDRYFQRRPWRTDWVSKAQSWIDAASDVYDIPTTRLVHTPADDAAGWGCYAPDDNETWMPKASVTTLFHEFRHAIQHHQPDELWYRVDPSVSPTEDDACAWSLSLFYHVRPELLADAATSGRVLHLTSADLT